MFTSKKHYCSTCLGEGFLMGGPDTYGKDCPDCRDWIKGTKDDPCDPMMPMSNPGDKNYEC